MTSSLLRCGRAGARRRWATTSHATTCFSSRERQREGKGPTALAFSRDLRVGIGDADARANVVAEPFIQLTDAVGHHTDRRSHQILRNLSRTGACGRKLQYDRAENDRRLHL